MSTATLRIKSILRDPALLVDLLESLLVVLLAVGIIHVTGEQQRYIVAVLIAVLAVVKGFSTKPFPVTVIPDLGRALLVAVGSFGLVHLTADQVTILATFLGTITTLIARGQITPIYDPAPLTASVVSDGEAANRIVNDSGAVDLGGLAILLVVVGLILLLLALVGVLPGLLWVGLILLIVGLVLAVVPRL